MTDRGKIAVSREWWLWRWYEAWAKRAHDDRSMVDLCHFCRVVAIFGPWRWFWQARYVRGLLTPWTIVVLTGVLTTLSLLLYWYPTEFTWGMAVLAAIFTFAVVFALAFYGLFRLIKRDPERVVDALQKACWIIFVRGFIWLWWPLVQLGLGIAFVATRIIAPAFMRTFIKPLVHVPIRDTLVPIVVWPLFPVAAYGVGLYFAWREVLVITGIILFCAIVVCVVIWLGVLLAEWLDDRRRQRPNIYDMSYEELEEYLRLQKEAEARRWRTAKLFWAWLVAKKHRWCPIIDPK